MEKAFRYFLLVIGTISLGLGMFGIVLPLLPTTPFLLLTAACYYRGSEKCYRYLMTHKVFGKYINDYRNKKGITLKLKIHILVALWLSMSFSIFYLNISAFVNILLILIGCGVTYHILSKKTLRS